MFASTNCQFSVYKNNASFKISSFSFWKFLTMTIKLKAKKVPVENSRKIINRKNSLKENYNLKGIHIVLLSNTIIYSFAMMIKIVYTS